MRQVVRYLSGVRLVCRMSLHLNILCKKIQRNQTTQNNN